MAIDSGWAGVAVAATAVIIIPTARWCFSVSSKLDRLVEDREALADHVKEDARQFSDLKASQAGLHAQVLAIQENLGIIHHPAPVLVGSHEKGD